VGHGHFDTNLRGRKMTVFKCTACEVFGKGFIVEAGYSTLNLASTLFCKYRFRTGYFPDLIIFTVLTNLPFEQVSKNLLEYPNWAFFLKTFHSA
jgi:hypothetical protein